MWIERTTAVNEEPLTMTETTKLSAFEKLLRIQAKNNARQCQCGSHIEGECPECDETSEETESTPVIEEEEKGVNPPPVGQECPTCGKVFKRLAKHKCKAESPKETHVQNGTQSRHVTESEKENDQSSKMKESGPPNDKSHKVKEPHKENDQSRSEIETRTENDQTTSKKEPTHRIDLYVNILMEKGSMNAIPLTEFLRPVTDAICKENEVDHWRNLPFGKAKGTLAVRTERFLKLQKESINIYVPPWCLEWEAVADVLRRYATNVFVGVK
jgi:hypothetical protein